MDDEARVARYRKLREERPELFTNPPGAPFPILSEPDEVAAAEAQFGQQLEAHGMPAAWALHGVVYEDPFQIILRDPVRTPSGHLGTYVRRVARNTDGVVVLPRHGDHVILVRHFRHSTRQWHLELPRGFGEKDQTPEQNAERELREELGAAAVRTHALGVVQPDTGLTSDTVHLFYVEIDLYDAAGEAAEGITGTVRVTPAELAELIRSGELNDGFTIAAWSRAVLSGLLPVG
ncbi:ADP-ribose pyrophosphatase [Catellatospora sp. TT07R-123]|uniref:NUDIX hydrolase n=1 Tax=Catellatospora sp. TT07R-123 TaxID=2733863 RepID=UPI001B0ED82E|nr:NUDIX hydrolase [Catellatospora sp. TT07R-123]GHJ43917.1 ADP-ribose pyrophosphatase [Catellatospora sp. TT07R-123]